MLGDGNCLFRSFALIITGSQQDHLLVRFAILSHMISIGHFLLQHHMSSNHTSVQNYIQSTRMDRDGTWGSEVEIFTLSHMLGTNIYSFHVGHSNWNRFSPADVDRSLSTDVRGMSMYIKHRYNHSWSCLLWRRQMKLSNSKLETSQHKYELMQKTETNCKCTCRNS